MSTIRRRNRETALRTEAGRLRSALREIIDLCLDVELGTRTSANAVYETLQVAGKELGRYRPWGARSRGEARRKEVAP